VCVCVCVCVCDTLIDEIEVTSEQLDVGFLAVGSHDRERLRIAKKGTKERGNKKPNGL
jgi:hypothetical protein